MIPTAATRWLKKTISRTLPVHYRINSAAPFVHLTFDDGPTRHTLRILEVLEKHSVPATFFILANRIPGNADVIRAIDAAGHSIGNHSYSHPDARRTAYTELRTDLDRCNATIREILPNWRPVLFRPPLGRLSVGYLYYVMRQHGQIILWSRDSKDYCTSASEPICTSLKAAQGGDILLFHDEFPVTFRALEWLIPFFLDNGIHIAPLRF